MLEHTQSGILFGFIEIDDDYLDGKHSEKARARRNWKNSTF